MLALAAAVASPARAQLDGGPGAAPGVAIPELVADPPQIRAVVGAAQVQLGQPFSVFVTATYRDIPEVNVPATIELGEAFEVTDRTWTDEQRADGTTVREFELEVMAWDVGDLQIPPIKLTYAVAGTAREVYTEPLPVRVISFIGEGDESLREIAGPIAVFRRDWTLVYVGAAVAGAIVLVLLVAYASRAVRRGRRRARRVAAGAPRPAHVVALERLAEVHASGALDEEDKKPAYIAMSEILRDYLGRRYDFPALDWTTSEIKLEIARRAHHVERECAAWLDECDLVKFANFRPSNEEAVEIYERARSLVDATAPRPEPEPAAPADAEAARA